MKRRKRWRVENEMRHAVVSEKENEIEDVIDEWLAFIA